MPKDENIKNGQIIAKYLFMILFIGLIPFIGIFFALTFNPYIQPFIIIADFTRDWPGMTSAHNPLMSKIMDVYLKSYPLFCVSYVSLTFKYTLPKGNPHPFKSILLGLLMIAIGISLTYYLTYCNHDLTREFRFQKAISRSNFPMTLYFMLSFAALYIMISFSLTGIVGNLRVILKGRS